MARNNILAFNHRRGLFHRRRACTSADRDKRRHLHPRALARHPPHVGCSDCRGVLQYLLRQTPSFGGGDLLQCSHLCLCASDSVSVGHDADQAERFCGLHAIHR